MSEPPQVTTLEKALVCAKCKTKTTLVEEHPGLDFEQGEVYLISCPNAYCKERPWFWCKSCSKKCYQSGQKGLTRHASSKKHVRNHEEAYPPSRVAAKNNDHGKEVAPVPILPTTLPNEDTTITDIPMEIEPVPAKKLDHDKTGGDPKEDTSKQTANYFPSVDLTGHEWLAELLNGTPIATKAEVSKAFGRPGLEHLKNYYVADLASGYGKTGGGIMCLTARAFQQSKESQLDDTHFPDYEEARWQLNNLIQYHSMNESQRKRQALLNESFMMMSGQSNFFKVTYLPPYKAMGRHYGSTGKHSMYNNLPCPRAEVINGVGYVSPLAIIAYAMGIGVPIDDFVVKPTDPLKEFDHLRKVHHVDECQKAMDWRRTILTGYYGSENGAPNSNSGAPKAPFVACIAVSDWRDGFEPSRTKTNRSGIDLKTITISPPKCLSNSVDNTFAVALGLKGSPGWKQVEH